MYDKSNNFHFIYWVTSNLSLFSNLFFIRKNSHIITNKFFVNYQIEYTTIFFLSERTHIL